MALAGPSGLHAYLPPANKVGQGNVIPVVFVHGGGSAILIRCTVHRGDAILRWECLSWRVPSLAGQVLS